MHRILLTALLILISVGLSVAQDVTLSGTITDKETNEPLVGASVITEDGKGVTTDLDGKYSIKLPQGKHSITYSFIQNPWTPFICLYRIKTFNFL